MGASSAAGQDASVRKSMERGQEIYISSCLHCHMAGGQGIPGIFPPFANSDYLVKDLDHTIRSILSGQKGEITIGGQVYNGEQPGFDLTDQETADILNFILYSWGNNGPTITSDRVKSARKK